MYLSHESDLPKDPVMLLSIVNMKLRDGCPSLEELCSAEDISPEELEERLSAVGFQYDPTRNQFV